MASPIAYSHEPATEVWVITPAGTTCGSAVKTGVVVQVRANVLTTGTNVNYDIRLGTEAGTTEFLDADIFATLADAVAEYEIRLT